MYYEIELRIPALKSCLHVVDACIGRLCRTALGGDDPFFREVIQTACVHAIEQAYGGDEEDYKLELNFAVGRGELRVTVTDFGTVTNALEHRPLAEMFPQLHTASYARREGTNVVEVVRRKAA